MSEGEGNKECVRGLGRYKYLEEEGETKMCHSPSSACFSVLLDWEAWESKRDGGVCRYPLKGKEHLDSLCCKKSHVSLSPHFFSFSVFLIALSFPVSLSHPYSLVAFLPFLTK